MTARTGTRILLPSALLPSALLLVLLVLPLKAEELYIPVAAHAAGVGGTVWRSDVEVKVRGTDPATFTIELLPEESDNSAPLSAAFSAEPGHSLRLEDLLDTVFAFEGTAALRITPTGGRILVSSRTYNNDPDGTYGQYIPALAAGDALGDETGSALIQLSWSPSADDGYRSNIGLLNVTGEETTLEVQLLDAMGTVLGSEELSLLPYELRQLNDISRLVPKNGSAEVANGYVLIFPKTTGTRYFAYASVVDNRSGDAIFIPAQEDDIEPPEEAERFVVFEAFVRPGCGNCAAAGQAIDQLADEFADRPVIFLQHDVDDPQGDRISRWWAAAGSGGSVTLPLVMVDSGFRYSNGYEEFTTVYRSMVEEALERPPLARLEVDRERTGDNLRFSITLTNLSGVALTSLNRARLHIIVYEETQATETGRWVRAASSIDISVLSDGATKQFSRQVSVQGQGINWDKVHSVVLVDYLPADSSGAYEMLQASLQP